MPAQAQVNVEPLRLRWEQRNGAAAFLSAASTVRGGNSRDLQVGTSAAVGGRSRRHLAYVSGTLDHAQHNEQVVVSQAFVHARYNYLWRRWVAAELFTQVERDEFRRLRVRDLVGVGPRWTLVDVASRGIAVNWGHAYLLEYTHRGATDTADEERSWSHRLSTYLAVRVPVQDRILLSSVTYYQPRWVDWEDFRLLSVEGVRFQITERLSSRIDATLRYEERVPEGVRRGDYEVKNSLELSF